MPGAGYTLTCTDCRWTTDVTEGENELGGHAWHYCTSCGLLLEHHCWYEIVCDACGAVKPVPRYDVQLGQQEPCSCAQGGTRHARRVEEPAPQCPEHPGQAMRELFFLEIVDEHDGTTGVPCHACGTGRISVSESGLLWD